MPPFSPEGLTSGSHQQVPLLQCSASSSSSLHGSFLPGWMGMWEVEEVWSTRNEDWTPQGIIFSLATGTLDFTLCQDTQGNFIPGQSKKYFFWSHYLQNQLANLAALVHTRVSTSDHSVAVTCLCNLSFHPVHFWGCGAGSASRSVLSASWTTVMKQTAAH